MLCGVGVNMLPGTQAELPGPGGPELTCQRRPPVSPEGRGPQARYLAAGRALRAEPHLAEPHDALGGFVSIKCSRLDLILSSGSCSVFFLYTCECICVNIRMMLVN